MENKKLIKPQIEYTGIDQFHDSIKEYSRNALVHIAKYGGAVDGLEKTDEVNIRNPTLIHKIEPQIYPSISFDKDSCYAQDPDIAINTALHSNLVYNIIDKMDFSHLNDINVIKYDDDDFDYFAVLTPLINDITDMSELNDKRLLTDRVMENQEKSNRVIDSFYSQFGLGNTESRNVKLDLSKEIRYA